MHNGQPCPVRRKQSTDDITLPNERAARREALRRNNIATSKANNYTKTDDWDPNPNIRGPKGEPAEFIDAEDLHGNSVRIPHHKHGHFFDDTNEFELPHFQGPNGEHISYPHTN